jgi:branched-chain amino acid transport system substrate-binding protein
MSEHVVLPDRPRVTRRALLGAGGAAAGALAVPGAAPARSHARGAAAALTIGCCFPLTGPLASDGKEMENGVRLAAEEINAAGGIAGTRIGLSILDTDVSDPAEIKASLQKHVSDRVDALYEGYLIQWPASMEIKANYGAPALNASTSIDQVKQIQGSPRYRNVFQIDPPESYYGLGFPGFLTSLRRETAWRPRNNHIFIVEGDAIYSQTISRFARTQAPRDGWKVTGVAKVTSGAVDWSPSARAARDSGAAVVMVTHYDPGDLAKWTKAWAANPGKAIVYMQYGPSIPSFLQLAGEAANGVMWATVTGVYNDPIGMRFRARYRARFGADAGFSTPGSGYDAVQMLARAWGRTGDGRDFAANVAHLRGLIHRGVNGGYALRDNVSLVYPAQTPDPGLGQAHLFFQIQAGRQRIIQPAPYVESPFQIPPWF